MSYISHCDFCGNEGNPTTGTRQAELYDGIAEVMMCWKCEPAAKFERERIIKLLGEEMERIRLMTDYPATNSLANIRAVLIKGENK